MNGEIVIEEQESLPSIKSGLEQITERLLKLSICIIKAHWNLEGVDYGMLHTRLGDYYLSVIESMDKVAERSVVLGGTPLVSKEGVENPNTMLVNGVIQAYEEAQRVIQDFISNEGSRDEVSEDLLIDVQGLLQFQLGFLNQVYKRFGKDMTLESAYMEEESR